MAWPGHQLEYLTVPTSFPVMEPRRSANGLGPCGTVFALSGSCAGESEAK